MFVLLNPRAGIGSARHLGYKITKELSPLGPEVRELGMGEDIKGTVLDAVHGGADEIVVAGGDGTVSAAADALIGTGVVLGIVPTGTTNMMAKELGIPSSVVLAARAVRQRPCVVHLDAVHNGERHFFYQVVIGFGAGVTSRTTTEEKLFLGSSAHLTAGLRQLADHRPLHVIVAVDGQELKGYAHQVVVANAGIMAAHPFRLGPGIRPDDGRVEVIVMSGRSQSEFLEMGVGMLGGNYHHRALRYLEARSEIHLEAEPKAVVKAAGATIGNTPLDLRIVPGAVDVIVPRRT